jgi:hypothetical protein
VWLVKGWVRLPKLLNIWETVEIVCPGMVLDTTGFCDERSRHNRHLASGYGSCQQLCGGSYELYFPQLDSVTAKSEQGGMNLINSNSA